MAIQFQGNNIVKMYYGGNAITQAYLNGDYFLPVSDNPKIYGFAVDETVSDPYSAVTYIEDSANFTPATMTDGVFDGGSWLDVYPFNQVRPCRLNSSGVVSYYLDPNNFTMQEDGTTSAATDRTMIEIQPIYWKFTKTTNGYEVRWSDTQVDSGYQALAHSRGDVLKGNLYLASYEGHYSESNNILTSRSGYTPTVSTTLANFRTYANNVGDGFGLMNFYTWTLLQILFISMFKNLNSQAALGNGIVNAIAMSNTGTLDTAGMYYGTTANETTGVKFMGIENIFGNTETFVDGIINTGIGHTINISDNTVFNDTGEGYAYSFENEYQSETWEYVTKVNGTQIGGFYPKLFGGSGITYYSDLGVPLMSYAQQLRVGGGNSPTATPTNAGMFCFYCIATNTTNAKAGARLQYLAP